MSDTKQRLYSGTVLDWTCEGVEQISSSSTVSNDTMADTVKVVYGTDLSRETGSILKRMKNASDAKALFTAVQSAGLNSVEDWERRFAADALDETADNVEDPGLGEAMRLLDQTLSNALCPRSKDAAQVAAKENRNKVYVPHLINQADGGTVYMAKTLSSSAKVRMAWDLNDNNQVVVVDEYEIWEKLLGWEKLKSFPHGKNKIQEEYGEQLSDDVLETIIGDIDTDTTSTTSDNSSSRGRATRTKPSEEVLNIAKSNKQRGRTKIKSKNIYEELEDGDTIRNTGISTLILFPTTTDLNMTDHWWVPGRISFEKGSAAIANCNKGTFEYLNQLESVWHIEDYLDQADDYVFETSAGPVTMNTVSTNTLVVHVVKEKTKERLLDESVVDDVPAAIHQYADKKIRSSLTPELPHVDDMIYAPITPEESFWLRPCTREHNNPEGGDAVICRGDASTRDLRKAYRISSGYWLYSRARLSDWDFDSTELSRLDKADHYFKLDDGGYEMIETLGLLHDQGKKPISESPEGRWL